MDHLNARQFAVERLAKRDLEFKWTPNADQKWKSELRKRIVDVIGLPSDRVALQSKSINHMSAEGYRRETVLFYSRNSLQVYGYLLIPDGHTQAGPAVICVPGHGEGVDSIVGIQSDDYQHDFALQCVRAGFVTLAIEPISFGHRNSAKGDQPYSCVPDSMVALSLGETMIAWRVHDAIVAIDYLLTRPEVDGARIATMGISGGGLVAFWTACLDDRVAAAVVSGYFNTFSDSIFSIDHCVDNFAPGLANLFEMPDMCALIAPRKLFVESGADDPIFPSHAFMTACERAVEIYGLDSEAFKSHLFEGGHAFNGSRAIPQLAAWLGNHAA